LRLRGAWHSPLSDASAQCQFVDRDVTEGDQRVVPGAGSTFTLFALSVNALKIFSGLTNGLVMCTPGVLEAAWAMQAISGTQAISPALG